MCCPSCPTARTAWNRLVHTREWGHCACSPTGLLMNGSLLPPRRRPFLTRVSKLSLAQDFCRPHPPLSDYETFWPQPSQVVIPLHEQQYSQKAVYSTMYQAILADSKQRNFKD